MTRLICRFRPLWGRAVTAVPDAWDECAACGHDHDDHHGNGCTADLVTVLPGHRYHQQCDCTGFEAPA